MQSNFVVHKLRSFVSPFLDNSPLLCLNSAACTFVLHTQMDHRGEVVGDKALAEIQDHENRHEPGSGGYGDTDEGSRLCLLRMI